MCFVDFEKAFDRVSHKKLLKVLTDMGFARHIVALIRSLYEEQDGQVVGSRPDNNNNNNSNKRFRLT